jgi:bifunctional UDP-N-acetylglucosamine pyrophosphorylase/glucosamine-1-phosphate N-acetyltransferase
MRNSEKIKIIILAGGKGKRMQNELPKVLAPLHGKPMIKYLLESVDKSEIDNNPVIIVGYKKELVIKELGKKYHYIIQEEQLGTGHAVNLVESYLKDKAKHVIVLYGDQPFTSAETIKKIAEKHLRSGKKITMATVTVIDFRDWRRCFENFSRVLRDTNNKIIRTIEKKDASEEDKKITEVNPCYFCFDAVWLWAKLKTLKNNNVQKEYYLTDVIKMATENNIDIESIDIEPHEALGANTKEELNILEKFI